MSELLEGETLNPARQLAAGSYRLCRLGAAGATEVSGEPVWLAGDYHPGEHQIVEVKPAGPDQNKLALRGRLRRRPRMSFAGHGVWVGMHFGYLHLFVCEQRQPECSVIVPGHIGPMYGDGESLYADVEEELVKVSATTGELVHIDGDGLAMLDGRIATARGEPSATPIKRDDGKAWVYTDKQRVVILDAQSLNVLTRRTRPGYLQHLRDRRIDGAFMVAADLRSGTHKRWRVTADGEVEECTSAP